MVCIPGLSINKNKNIQFVICWVDGGWKEMKENKKCVYVYKKRIKKNIFNKNSCGSAYNSFVNVCTRLSWSDRGELIPPLPSLPHALLYSGTLNEGWIYILYWRRWNKEGKNWEKRRKKKEWSKESERGWREGLVSSWRT